MKSVLPFEALEKVLLAAEALGVERERLAAEAGIALKDGSVGGVSFEDLAATYEAAARLSGDQAFGLHLGERTVPRSYGILGYLVANSLTLGEAVTNLVLYQALWSDGAGFDVHHRPGRVDLRYWNAEGVVACRRRQESEQMLSALLSFMRSAVAEPLVPLEVSFEHEAPADRSHHDGIFGCRLRFGATKSELSFSADVLDKPLPLSDANLADILKRQAQIELGRSSRDQPFPRRIVSLAAAALLRSGDASLEGLARAAGMGPRTLQRRLREQGLTLRTLVDRARIDLAQRLLEERKLSLAQIAFRLGYAQTSAFHRAFRRRTGSTPQQFRASRVGATGAR